MNSGQPPENRSRRATDQLGGLLDAAQQAVRLERMEGQHQLLAQRVSTGMENVTNTLNSMQVEIRGFGQKLTELAELRFSHDSNERAVEDIKRSLSEMNSRLEDWFDDYEERNTVRWRQYEANRDAWRTQHEADNEKTKADLNAEIRNVREVVIKYAGYSAAIGALGGVIIAGFLWTINYRFDTVKEDTQDVSKDMDKAENRQMDLIKRVSDLELYLARGGRIPEETYNPQTRKETSSGSQESSGQSGK